MEKLPMCRICLVEDVNMYVVVNKNLHELYEKLTDIPFVTKDSRPILACFFCCAKLKQCFRFLRKCLEAEELFVQMMNGDYEPNPSISQDNLHSCTGFIKSPTVHVSIVDECETDSIAIKEEVPAICERQDDVIEPNEEYQSDDVVLELENLNNTCLGTEDIPPHLSESDSGGDVNIEVEEEQELTNKKRRAVETNNLELENLDNSRLDEEDILAHGSEFDSEDDVPLMEFKIEEEEQQEVPKEKRRAVDTKSVPAAKKPKLDVQKNKNEDLISPKHMKKGQEQTKNTEIIKKSTSKTKNITNKNSTKTSPKVTINTTCIKEKKNIQTTKSKENTASFQCIDSSYIKRHSLRHNSLLCDKQKPYKCDFCQNSFSEKGKLKTHIRTHTGDKPYKCDICQSSFSQQVNLESHIRTHTGAKPYKCDICQNRFNRKGNLKSHILTHTGEKPYKCDICQNSFSRKNVLENHIRTHTGEKPYKCDVCQSSFIQKCHLETHIRTHTGVKPYKCDICKKSFSRKDGLENHFRTHTGEKPYKCDICKKSFSRKDGLENHFRTHTGEKPYKCDICKKSFSRKDGLENHFRTHTGVKPYKCDICQSSFSRKDVLENHIRTHTGEKPYKCDRCPISYLDKRSLKYHVLKHHT